MSNMNDIIAVKKVFDQWAESGRTDDSAAGHVFSGVKILKDIDKKDFSFLDIGCGNGWMCRKVAQMPESSKVVGLDISQGMINVCDKRQQTDKELYICEDFSEWQPKGTFDVIFSFEVIYYFNEIADNLKKIYDLLSNDGLFLMGIDCYDENIESHSWPEYVGLNMKTISIKDWVSLLDNAGFNDIKVTNILNPDAKDAWKREQGTLYIKSRK